MAGPADLADISCNSRKPAHLRGTAAVARRELAPLRRPHAGRREGDGDALLGHVHLDAVPAEHVLADARHAAGALEERQVLLRAASSGETSLKAENCQSSLRYPSMKHCGPGACGIRLRSTVCMAKTLPSASTRTGWLCSGGTHR